MSLLPSGHETASSTVQRRENVAFLGESAITGSAIISYMPTLTQGNVYHLEQIPIPMHLRTGFLPRSFKLPRPVFPKGSQDEVLAVKDYTGPWYIVYKGFRAGVYTTWANGACNAVTGVSENKHEKVIDVHYKDACSMLMESFQNSQVCNVPYIIMP
jgi:hypothetical protein